MLLPPLTLPLLILPTAHALEGVPLDPPLPVHGDPVDLQAVAWDLPQQDPAWLTEDVDTLRCPVTLRVHPDGSHDVSAEHCPASMQADAIDAASRWRFAPLDTGHGEDTTATTTPPTATTVTFVVRYSSALGTMTLHAELDPGAIAAVEGLPGRPGLRLVHEGELLTAIDRKLPGKARKAGISDTTCRLRARVTSGGQASQVLVDDCPSALSHDAQKRVLKARFLPTFVDGQPQEDVLDVVVTYHR